MIIALPEVLRGFDEYRMLIFGPVLVLAVVLRENGGKISYFLSEKLSLGRRRPRYNRTGLSQPDDSEVKEAKR